MGSRKKKKSCRRNGKKQIPGRAIAQLSMHLRSQNISYVVGLPVGLRNMRHAVHGKSDRKRPMATIRMKSRQVSSGRIATRRDI